VPVVAMVVMDMLVIMVVIVLLLLVDGLFIFHQNGGRWKRWRWLLLIEFWLSR
jgi:hypothetical protein